MKRRAIVTNLHDGLGYDKNDNKYIGEALDKVINIVDDFGNGKLLTDFYMPKYKDELNDYSYHGFLFVSIGNIEFV